MHVLKFLEQNNTSLAYPVFCFVTEEYPVLLFALLKQQFRYAGYNLSTLHDIEHYSSLKALLEISFLGEKTCFWLSAELFATYPQLVKDISQYQGPNAVAFLNKQALSKASHVINVEIPATLDRASFTALFTVLYPQHVANKKMLIQKIFNYQATLPLESALLVMHYCMIIGASSESFIAEWLPRIVFPEKSLFTLGSAFFAKKSQQFFTLWHSIKDDYSEPFWTSFWSEQLFRAHSFIALTHSKNIAQAKRIAYRLPFSFMQKDWKSISMRELQNAHNHVYTLDWNSKNGLTTSFEHFYCNFFLNRFV